MSAPKILVADDSKTVRTQVSQILTAANYDVTVARDGREAMQLAVASRPDLMVLDVNMPLLDGYGVCLELRQLGMPFSGIPIVFLTSAKSQALEILGEEVGAYLQKPVDRDALLEAVQSFVECHSA